MAGSEPRLPRRPRVPPNEQLARYLLDPGFSEFADPEYQQLDLLICALRSASAALCTLLCADVDSALGEAKADQLLELAGDMDRAVPALEQQLETIIQHYSQKRRDPEAGRD